MNLLATPRATSHNSVRPFASVPVPSPQPMLAKLHTFSLLGIDALPVEVEVDVSPGALPKTVLVGLPEEAVKESTHRIERAMVNSGFVRPQDRVVINLAPAELPKQAGSFDLPIALGILAGSGQFKSRTVRAIRRRRRAGARRQHAAGEGRAVDGDGRRRGREQATQAPRHHRAQRERRRSGRRRRDRSDRRRQPCRKPSPSSPASSTSSRRRSRLDELFQELSHYDVDFADVRGQEMAKRAVTIAAAGGHNLLMVGPPGSGKTMLAKRVPTILPDAVGRRVDRDHAHLQRDGPAAGRASRCWPRGRSARRITRSANAGLVGGGSTPTPGEISLAHNGVLFLDELPEFNRRTLEVLRQPLEDGHVTISRALQFDDVPGQFHADRVAQPLPLRLSQRPAPRLPLHGAADRALHGQDQRAAARPHRPPHRSAGRAVQGAERPRSRGTIERRRCASR